MGFDLDRSEAGEPEPPSADNSVFSLALSRNLLAERFAIDAYRKIAEGGQNYDKATQILAAIIEDLRNLNGALAG